MPRSKKSQSKHDAEVQRVAKGYERRGYKVKADIPGYERPSTIGGYRPDVVAKDGHDRKIVEVETRDSVDRARDQKQQQAFRSAANRSKSTSFRRTIAD